MFWKAFDEAISIAFLWLWRGLSFWELNQNTSLFLQNLTRFNHGLKMVLLTRLIESMYSFWWILILRLRKLTKYLCSKCDSIYCLFYMVIASKIKLAYCCMKEAPGCDSDPKSFINKTILIFLAIFTIWIDQQLKVSLYFNSRCHCTFCSDPFHKEQGVYQQIESLGIFLLLAVQIYSVAVFICWWYRYPGLW